MRQDADYNRIGASLRKGKLFVKMTCQKAYILAKTLEDAGQDLLLKETFLPVGKIQRAIAFAGSAEDWEEDLRVLGSCSTDEKDPSGVIRELASAVRAGLANESYVDWIDRTGGPAPKVPASDALEKENHEGPYRDIPLQ